MKTVTKISQKMNIKVKYAIALLHLCLFSLLFCHWLNLLIYVVVDFKVWHQAKYDSLFWYNVSIFET